MEKSFGSLWRALLVSLLCALASWVHAAAMEESRFTLNLSATEQQWVATHPVVRVAFDANYAPYSFIDSRGEFAGVAVDITREIFKRAGIQLEIYPHGQWQTLYQAAQKRDVDVIATLVQRPGREQWFDFSRPYLSLSQYIITRKQSLRDLSKKSDLAYTRVALVQGYSMADVLLEEFPSIEPMYVATLSDALKAVDSGHADATIADIGMAHNLIRKHQLENLSYATLYSTGQSKQAFGIRNDWPELTSILNKALLSLSEQELLNIYARWALPDIDQVSNSLFGLGDWLSPEEKDWLEQQQEIRIGVMDAWPPINFINRRGEGDGIGADYLAELNQVMGGRLKPVPGNWADLYQALQEGRVDALMDLTPLPERRKDFLFTRPYLNIPHVIVASKDTPFLNNESDLSGKTLALEKGFGNVNYFSSQYPEVNIKLYDNTAKSLGAVARGEADAYAGNRAVALHIISRELITNLRVHGRLNKEGSILAIGVRRDWPILADILDHALQDFNPQVKEKINLRWVGGAQSFTEANLTAAEQQWLKQHPVIRLASDAAWPPYESIDEQGNYHGIAADYINLLETRLGISFKRSPVRSWSSITDMVRHRELDLFPAAMKTPQRELYARFTQPYIKSPMMIVTRNDTGYLDGLHAIGNRPIAIEQGYASYDLLNNTKLNLQIMPYPNTLTALLAVSSGEAFAYVGNIATLGQLVQQNGITNLKVSGHTPFSFELAMGVRSDWPELVAILQKTLDTISPAEQQAILNKWVNVRVEKPADLTYLWYALAAIICITALSLLWNISLNRKVRLRTAQLHHQARFDKLTRLPNRVEVLAHLQEQLPVTDRHNTSLAALFIDLDDFKKINDTLGHETGDQVLIQAGQRLRDTVHEGDLIGRLGGDEFILLLDRLEHPDHARIVAEKILHCFAKPFQLDERELILTSSIGIALYPADADNPASLLRNADIAMYHAKQQGRNTYTFFRASMNQQVHRNLLLEEQLHGALERGEFYLCFQPQINARGNQIAGFEALLRWKNPALGEVYPDEFIPLAEHNGMIVPIGKYVVEQGLETLRQWQQTYHRPFSLAVNLSPRQFRDPGLVDFIAAALKKADIDSACLELEITEGVLLSGQNYVSEALQGLKRLGVDLAMDDFGAGYSSLSYLRNYPFDRLKIDRQFVQDITTDPADYNLVKATIAMAHSLGLTVVAEGVETEQQAVLLKRLSCDLLQGYLYSKPKPAIELETLLLNADARSPESSSPQPPASPGS